MKKANSPKGRIKLPVQTLNWNSIPDYKNLKKIFFQFDVNTNGSGIKIFKIVAYPGYKINGKWQIGKKIDMPVKNSAGKYYLDLPLTLGNLELKVESIKKWIKGGVRFLTFIPHKYTDNPHAEYSVWDESSTSSVMAKPSPPAPPET